MPPARNLDTPATSSTQVNIDTLTALVQQLVDRDVQQTQDVIKAMVAEQVKAALTAISSASNTPSPASRSPKPPKVSEANLWDGAPTTINRFFNELALVFAADKDRYSSVDAKIRYAFSKFTGDHAGQFKDNIIGRVLKGEKTWETWDDFEKEIRTSFPSTNLMDQAQRELESLKQGSKSAEEFFTKFDTHRHHSEYNDAALIAILKRNLNPTLLANIYQTYRIETELKTYEQWKTAAVERDRNSRDLAYVTGTSMSYEDDDPTPPPSPLPPHSCTTVEVLQLR
ncbi:hypothetical protein H1R20_g12485, partial [Candolleomyces eurysporus]